MVIEINRGLKCLNTPKVVRKKIKKDLTFENPDYKKAIERGGYTSLPPEIVLFDSEKTTFWLPRGYIFFLIRFLKYINHPYKIVDETTTLNPINFKFKGKLRDYQKEAQQKVLQYPVGVLQAGTGSGKTVSAISIIAERKQPTLILVHTKELLFQWKDRLKEFLGIDCGLIGDGKFEVKEITVGTIQTVKKRREEIMDSFGFLIIDECHRYATPSSAFTIQDFSAKYYLGLTATPFRSDGLGKIIFACIGPKLHVVNQKNLFNTKAILRPDVYIVNTNFYYMFTNDYSRMITELSNDINRNMLICSEIEADLKRFNDAILIVSDRKKHVNLLQEMLQNDFGIKGISLTGGTNKKKRTEYVEQIKQKKCKVVFATTSLIGEGFDAPYLTALFLTTPVKFSGRLIQACGRVLRPAEGKTPRVYDFRDNNIDVLRYSGYGRDRVYKKEWAK